MICFKKRLTCTSKKELVIYSNTCTNKKRRGRNVTKKEESKIQIAKVISINYDFCHNCKQRKPAEAMVKCGSYSNSKFVEKPLRVLYVNNSTIVRSKNDLNNSNRRKEFYHHKLLRRSKRFL